VLDDYQFIRGMAVHNLLYELTQHWPESLHLVLISRIDPAFPLYKLRAKGMVREIRIPDLRFTAQETADYLKHRQFIPLSQDILHRLEVRFEGWPAGLHLAALSMRSTGSLESVLSALSTENSNITDYLMDEVLSNQPAAIQNFLLKTSILNRFCVPLCVAVIGEENADENVRACLDWIEYTQLFITPLEDHRGWYRYHHLFQELLRKRLFAKIGPGEVADLQRLASAWFNEHDLVDLALDHALMAGDQELAARQMIARWRDVINDQDRLTLERWLGLLPEEMIQRHAELLIIKAWVLQFIWKLDLQARLLQLIEDRLAADGATFYSANDPQILRGQILALKSQHAYFSNQTARAIDLSRQALALLPPSWGYVRGGAMVFLGLSMQASGQGPQHVRLVLEEFEACVDKTQIYAVLLCQTLCYIYFFSGELAQTMQMAQMLVRRTSLRGAIISKNWGDWFLGVTYYLRNELEEAAHYFNQICENRYTAQITVYRDAVAGLAFIYQIKGESSAAWQMVESISQFDLELSGSEDNRTCSLRARLMLLQGDLEGAHRWAETFRPTARSAVILAGRTTGDPRPRADGLWYGIRLACSAANFGHSG
jgi:LuxR family transcriptional regulator, maltose regulon positive regulatory protein